MYKNKYQMYIVIYELYCQYIDEQGNAFWITEYFSYQIYDAEKTI